MSRLADLIAQLCPDGVKYKPLSECVVLPSIPRGLKRGQYESSGTYPIVDQGRGQVAGYSSDETKLVKDIPGIVFGDHTREIKYIDHFFVPGADGVKWIRAVDDVDIRYLFHSLSSLAIPSRGYNRHWNVVRDMSIPVPPLEVQREIVRILDQFTTLEAELEAELEARRAQYEHYRTQLLSYDSMTARGPVSWIPLRELGVWSGGGTPSKSRADYWDEGNIPWITPKDMRSSKIQNSMMNITDRAVCESNVKLIEAPSIALVVRSSILQHTFPVAQIDVDATFNQDMKALVVDSDRFEHRYIYYALSANGQEILRQTSKQGGSVNSLVVPRLMDFEIPVPALDEQQRIADLLDRFDALVNDISSGLPSEIAARRAQYEHYRGRLLSIPEKKAE